MKFPLLTSFFGGILIFAACAYFAYSCSLPLFHKHEQAKLFQSLAKPDAEELRSVSFVCFSLAATEFRPLRDMETALPREVQDLIRVRRQAAQELWPMIDLRLAKDYAVMTSLDKQGGNLTLEAEHRKSATDLLRSLGWQDVSEGVIVAVGDEEVHSRFK